MQRPAADRRHKKPIDVVSGGQHHALLVHLVRIPRRTSLTLKMDFSIPATPAHDPDYPRQIS